MNRILFVILSVAAIIFLIRYTIADEELARIISGPCGRSINYNIGKISPTFNLEEATLKKLLEEIDHAWSAAAGKPLFKYDEDSKLAINIIYDTQQQMLDKEKSISSRIEYEKLSYTNAKQELSQLENQHEIKKQAYKQAVLKYNRIINNPTRFKKKYIAQQAQNVERKRAQLHDLTDRLNQKVERVNRISEQINEMVADYNANFDTAQEFNQGVYQKNITGKSINIYSYRNLNELKLVLAHEMGHALGLRHVQNTESIMYYLIKDQPMGKLVLSKQDKNALRNLCGN